MTYHDDPAFARTAHMTDGGTYTSKQDGLTKREYFAVMAMQGAIASRSISAFAQYKLASDCVLAADSLIEALNKSDEE